MQTETITGFLFIAPLYQLAYNFLVLIYRNFGNDLGVAIIVFTLALRLITLPFTFRQIANAKKNKEFQDKYKLLQAKHKGDKEKLAAELTKLQAEYLPAQIGGCLPLILQILFFFQIYYVVRNTVEVGVQSFNRINYSFIPEFAATKVFDLNFFGINLGKSPAQIIGKSITDINLDDIEKAWPYLVLVLLVGLSQFIASKVSLELAGMGKTPEDKLAEAKKREAARQKLKKGEPEDVSFADAMQQSSRQMVYFLPFMTMLFATGFPAGLALYWTVNSGFAIIQQIILKKDLIIQWIKKGRGRTTSAEMATKIDELPTEPVIKVTDKPSKNKQKARKRKLKRQTKR